MPALQITFPGIVGLLEVRSSVERGSTLYDAVPNPQSPVTVTVPDGVGSVQLGLQWVAAHGNLDPMRWATLRTVSGDRAIHIPKKPASITKLRFAFNSIPLGFVPAGAPTQLSAIEGAAAAAGMTVEEAIASGQALEDELPPLAPPDLLDGPPPIPVPEKAKWFGLPRWVWYTVAGGVPVVGFGLYRVAKAKRVGVAAFNGEFNGSWDPMAPAGAGHANQDDIYFADEIEYEDCGCGQ